VAFGRHTMISDNIRHKIEAPPDPRVSSSRGGAQCHERPPRQRTLIAVTILSVDTSLPIHKAARPDVSQHLPASAPESLPPATPFLSSPGRRRGRRPEAGACVSPSFSPSPASLVPAPAPAAPRQYVNNSTAAGQGAEDAVTLRRRERLALRAKIRRFSRLKSTPRIEGKSPQYTLRHCGVVRCSADGFVRLKVAEGVGYAEGVVHCGSVHGCPVCAAVIRTKRSRIYADSADRWLKAGHFVYMVTLTFPHYMGDDLGEMWDLVSDGTGYLTSNRAWGRLKFDLGCRPRPPRVFAVDSKGVACKTRAWAECDIGYRRVVECTWGCENAWHPHCHMLVYLRNTEATSKLDGARRLFLIDRHFRTAWPKWVTDHGFRLPSDKHGVKVEECYRAKDAAEYLVKTQDGHGVGMELARGDLKKGRKESLTPFEIADRAGDGEEQFLQLWWTWEKASKGRKMTTESQGLAAMLGEVEVTDQELADEDAGGDDVAAMTGQAWTEACNHRCADAAGNPDAVRNGLESALFEAAVAGGLAAVNAVLDAHGYGHAHAPVPRADDG
jgi:hypothetical protein